MLRLRPASVEPTTLPHELTQGYYDGFDDARTGIGAGRMRILRQRRKLSRRD